MSDEESNYREFAREDGGGGAGKIISQSAPSIIYKSVVIALN